MKSPSHLWMMKSLIVLALLGSFALPGVALAHTLPQSTMIFWNHPFVKDHSCGQSPYHFGVDYYMYANGSKNCNTIKIPITFYGSPCDFMIMNPSHGTPYAGTTAAFVGIFDNPMLPGPAKIVKIPPTPVNTWVSLGSWPTSSGARNDVWFEVGDNNGAAPAPGHIIGVSQMKEVCTV